MSKAPPIALALRGFQAVYRLDEVNHCPGCGRTHWLIGRVTAECAFCSTALPLDAAPEPNVLGEVAFAVRAMRSKKRREIAKLETNNPNDEHLPSMRARLERLEEGHRWLNRIRGKWDD
jgi:hypothetical protein